MNKKYFKLRVLGVVRKIPPGQTLSYKRVAELVGSPLASRAVGNIMKNNFDPTVPCHRVICSDGRAGGYNGGVGKKIARLIDEGVKFKDGRLLS